MADLTEVCRVTVIADTSLERTLIDEFLKLGARGYTTINCFGKGRHDVMEDPYTGRSLVQIEVLARQPVAEAILDHIHKPQFKSYPVIGYMDVVKAHAGDTFF